MAIKSGRESFAAGDEVSGTVEVVDSMNAKTLTLALEYRDFTFDYHAVSRAVAVESPLHEGGLVQGASYPFSIVLPADALPNQKGKEGSTTWGLNARIVRFGPDLNVWQPLLVPAASHAGST